MIGAGGCLSDSLITVLKPVLTFLAFAAETSVTHICWLLKKSENFFCLERYHCAMWSRVQKSWAFEGRRLPFKALLPVYDMHPFPRGNIFCTCPVWKCTFLEVWGGISPFSAYLLSHCFSQYQEGI